MKRKLTDEKATDSLFCLVNQRLNSETKFISKIANHLKKFFFLDTITRFNYFDDPKRETSLPKYGYN